MDLDLRTRHAATMPVHVRASLLIVFSMAAATERADAQWVEAPGHGWLDVTVYHIDTMEQFELDGNVREIFAEGHAVNTSVFLTFVAGMLPGVDAWVQAPYHRLKYSDVLRDRLRTGIGDIRLHLRVAPLQYFDFELPVALRGGVKIPMGDFAVDAEVIPLGDGQRDWELAAEIGHSFHPSPIHVGGWAGYRWREPNPDLRRDFGNEAFFLVQAGGNYGLLGMQVIAEGMKTTTTPVFENVPLRNTRRSILQFTPQISLEIRGGALRVGSRIPVWGRNLLAGRSWVVGYFTSWAL